MLLSSKTFRICQRSYSTCRIRDVYLKICVGNVIDSYNSWPHLAYSTGKIRQMSVKICIGT